MRGKSFNSLYNDLLLQARSRSSREVILQELVSIVREAQEAATTQQSNASQKPDNEQKKQENLREKIGEAVRMYKDYALELVPAVFHYKRASDKSFYDEEAKKKVESIFNDLDIKQRWPNPRDNEQIKEVVYKICTAVTHKSSESGNSTKYLLVMTDNQIQSQGNDKSQSELKRDVKEPTTAYFKLIQPMQFIKKSEKYTDKAKKFIEYERVQFNKALEKADTEQKKDFFQGLMKFLEKLFGGFNGFFKKKDEDESKEDDSDRTDLTPEAKDFYKAVLHALKQHELDDCIQNIELNQREFKDKDKTLRSKFGKATMDNPDKVSSLKNALKTACQKSCNPKTIFEVFNEIHSDLREVNDNDKINKFELIYNPVKDAFVNWDEAHKKRLKEAEKRKAQEKS